MEDHLIETKEKDEFINKMHANIKMLKEKFKEKSSSDLIPFYEEQINIKDQTINVN